MSMLMARSQVWVASQDHRQEQVLFIMNFNKQSILFLQQHNLQNMAFIVTSLIQRGIKII